MRTEVISNTVYYCIDKRPVFDSGKTGAWMYTYTSVGKADQVCRAAIENGIVQQCMHPDCPVGTAVFLVDYDDYDTHRRILQFFIDNKLIPTDKAEGYLDIPFYIIVPSESIESGMNFTAFLRLSDFVDIRTGEFHKNIESHLPLHRRLAVQVQEDWIATHNQVILRL